VETYGVRDPVVVRVEVIPVQMTTMMMVHVEVDHMVGRMEIIIQDEVVVVMDFDVNEMMGKLKFSMMQFYIQNLPRNVTRDEIMDAFSTVGTIKTDGRSGGPKIWLYKDRDTGEGNGRATVTYEDNESANKAISKFNDQQIESLGVVVRVQLAQRRPRNNDNNDRGARGGYRGGRNNWDNYQSRPGFNSGGRWTNTGGDFADNRNGGGFRGRGGGSDSFRNDGDQGGSYRGGSRGGPYRGASRGNGGSSNYSPY